MINRINKIQVNVHFWWAGKNYRLQLPLLFIILLTLAPWEAILFWTLYCDISISNVSKKLAYASVASPIHSQASPDFSFRFSTTNLIWWYFFRNFLVDRWKKLNLFVRELSLLILFVLRKSPMHFVTSWSSWSSMFTPAISSGREYISTHSAPTLSYPSVHSQVVFTHASLRGQSLVLLHVTENNYFKINSFGLHLDCLLKKTDWQTNRPPKNQTT